MPLLGASMLCLLLAGSPANAVTPMTPTSSHTGPVTICTTAKGSDAPMTRSEAPVPTPGHKLTEVGNSVYVDTGQRYQAFMGIGGAITDAAAETSANLDAKRQAEFLKAYYDPKDGIGYTLARTRAIQTLVR